MTFFDFHEYITQEFVTTPEKITGGQVCKIFIYISADSIQHHRAVTSLVNFVGSIAGVYELIFTLAVIVFGDYVRFRSYLLWMKSLYKIQIVQQNNSNQDLNKT